MSAQPIPEPEFEQLIVYIQESRGLDFRGYKRTSLRRRISLRMEEVGAEDFAAYQSYLEVHPQEFAELLNTVLINVTSFFRDAEGWATLRDEVIPQIIARGDGQGPIRVWSVGCASGEEPYSVAMLLAEALGVKAFCQRVKIYATDLDEEALQTARHAIYPQREVEQLPPELVTRYFERSGSQYAFQRDLRKCVIFGRHNVVFDAPISRIDLLLCRNLLIYLETDTQNMVLPRLHYALVDDGVLFLGKAETQLARSRLFRPINMKHRIFAKQPQLSHRLPGGGLSLGTDARDNTGVHLQMLESIVDSAQAAYFVIDSAGLLIFANAMAKRRLDVGEADIGRPFHELSISYRPAELRSRIDEVQRDGRPLRLEHLEYHRPPAEPVRLSVEVSPMYDGEAKSFATLLSFTDTTRVYQLQQELEAAQESLETTIEELQSANEELETTNEELQSTNEELETTNEELQSTNEELETMNEELRSTNEEVEAVNDELRRQSSDATEFRRHVESVLRSVNAGVAVLGADLRVNSWNRWNENVWGLRYEEVRGQRFLNLDIGLPVALLREPLERVLAQSESQVEMELEGLDRRGRSLLCLVRVLPLVYNEGPVPGVIVVIDEVSREASGGGRASILDRTDHPADHPD